MSSEKWSEPSATTIHLEAGVGFTVPKVLFASLSEGAWCHEAGHKLLQRTLSEVAEVTPWRSQFQLSRTLRTSSCFERLLNTSDFEVLVLPPDDLLPSGEKCRQMSAARQCGVRTLAVFGRLGRSACFSSSEAILI